MNVNREKIQKMFDEHFIDECDEVFDASEEIIDFAIKAVKNCSIPDVSCCSKDELKKEYDKGFGDGCEHARPAY